eukprot:4370477-Pyramimonas_sp.AAC.2
MEAHMQRRQTKDLRPGGSGFRATPVLSSTHCFADCLRSQKKLSSTTLLTSHCPYFLTDFLQPR